MKIPLVDKTLAKLAELIQQGRFEELETDTLEIKPVSADGAAWAEQHKSINAFLNARGGIVILGVKEEGRGAGRKYVFTGWKPHAEPNLKDIPKQFTDQDGNKLDLSECFPAPEIRDFLDGKVAILLVDELPSDRKYVFYKGEAYKRVLTGDQKISQEEIERQEEFKEQAAHAQELRPVLNATIDDLDVDKLNEYIQHLNRQGKVETIKPDLAAAKPFLERKYFLKDNRVTTLGVLVCGRHPTDLLGFRCQVHGYVDVPQEVARDKQDLSDNVLPLMEASLAYILRNIQVGVSIEQGGTARAQYPEELLRETVNNALAHRDYSIDRHVILAIKPGEHIEIRNPGSFRKHMRIEAPNLPIPLRRLLPEAKPRNPKLADVLRVYRKWEGRGIGMATLVNLCLENKIDLPYYRFKSEEVALYLCAGHLVDERMERLFQSFDGYIEDRLQGNALTAPQKNVLAYLLKSEWANEDVCYTILLTHDNNHSAELRTLKQGGLVVEHERSTPEYPIYVVDRVLAQRDYLPELRRLFGGGFDLLDPLHKKILGIVHRFENYSKSRSVSAKQASFTLWYDDGGSEHDIKAFDSFYRRVRTAFNRLEKAGFLSNLPQGRHRYVLNRDFAVTHLV
jgi:predicted HTH transcriptional regulator